MVKSPPSATTTRNNNNMEESRADEVKYRGVRKRKWGKWVSEIRLPNSRERIWLGSYDSPEKAARAFDAALFCLRGNTANFNFPHQPPNIPGATDLHPSQIQAIAATYANEPTFSSSSPSQDHQVDQQDNNNNNDYEQLQSTLAGSSSNNFIMNHVDDHGGSFMMDHSHIHSNEGVPDFGIFPGFDDYFMPMHPPLLTTDYNYGSEEQVFDSQDPSFQLWNF